MAFLFDMTTFYNQDEIIFSEHRKRTNFVNITGSIFGKLTVLGYAGKELTTNGNPHHYWFCKCECGNVTKVVACSLKAGKSNSCGCLSFWFNNKPAKTRVDGKRRKIYSIWVGMRQRCENPKNKRFKYYGARNITVCERWKSFENFLADMGDKPEGLSLDRIDNNKGYYKENCRWATQKVQCNNSSRNRLITHDGKTQNITQWAEELGITKNKFYYRINHGWTIEKIISNT